MKQYPEIFVSCPREESTYSIRKGLEWLELCAKKESNVIVLTLEEAKEMWDMAKSGPDFPGLFELFLKSKGISL